LITATEAPARSALRDTDRRAMLHKAALAIAGGSQKPSDWIIAMQFAHPSLHGHHVTQACRDYAEAVRAQEDLVTDASLWAFYYPDLTGPDQRDAALERADQDVDATMSVLMNGECR
jgi:hypothetical protein